MFFHQSMWQQITTTNKECSCTNPWLSKPNFKHVTNWMTCNNRWWTSDSSECYWFEQRPFTTIVYNEILFRSLYFSHSFYETWICFLAMMYQYSADPWPKCHYSSQIELWAKFSKAPSTIQSTSYDQMHSYRDPCLALFQLPISDSYG